MVGLVLAYLVVTTLTTFGLQVRAQRVVSSSEAALVFTFEPVVTATSSWLLLGETLRGGQWLGAAVIMTAVGWPSRRD
jgi:drug/metabolite transporter (DMT)-like permease